MNYLRIWKENLSKAIDAHNTVLDYEKMNLFAEAREAKQLEREYDEKSYGALWMFFTKELIKEAKEKGVSDDDLYSFIIIQAENTKLDEKIKKGNWFIKAKQYKNEKQKELAIKKLEKLQKHREFNAEQLELIL